MTTTTFKLVLTQFWQKHNDNDNTTNQNINRNSLNNKNHINHSHNKNYNNHNNNHNHNWTQSSLSLSHSGLKDGYILWSIQNVSFVTNVCSVNITMGTFLKLSNKWQCVAFIDRPTSQDWIKISDWSILELLLDIAQCSMMQLDWFW